MKVDVQDPLVQAYFGRPAAVVTARARYLAVAGRTAEVTAAADAAATLAEQVAMFAAAEAPEEYDTAAETTPGDTTAVVEQTAETAAADTGSEAAPVPAVPVPDPGPIAEQLARVDAEIAALQAMTLDAATAAETDAALGAAVIATQTTVNRLAAAQLALVGAADTREVFRADAAVTMASWLRTRARIDHGAAQQLVDAAARLCWLPGFGTALSRGEINLAHVAAVTKAMVPRRRDAIREAEAALLLAARHGLPRDIARLVAKISDTVDDDGTDVDPLDESGPDERRTLDLSPTIDGLWNLRGALDVLTGELLATLLESFTTPDPTDTPASERRSAAQRRHDALDALLRHLADNGTAPTRHGAAPHALLMVDLLVLAGLVDPAAGRTTTLRFTGATTLAIARRLLAAHVKTTVVLTAGPFRVVGVGATQRLLPAWLRPMLQMIHQRCRGPDCDRPAIWGDAHHVEDWNTHHDTDLNHTVPLCRAHHQLVTDGIWTLHHDTDTAICTWTGSDGRVITTHPPAP